MPFKIRSEVVIYENPNPSIGKKEANYTVYFRERQLRPGDRIRVEGWVADVEEKLAKPLKGKVKILDDDHFEIKWSDGDAMTLSGDDLKAESGYPFHGHSMPIVPDIFTLIDRLCIPRLVESKMEEIEGGKSVYRKTELVYEPTLPPKSRR